MVKYIIADYQGNVLFETNNKIKAELHLGSYTLEQIEKDEIEIFKIFE